jgi:hypothetical protein
MRLARLCVLLLAAHALHAEPPADVLKLLQETADALTNEDAGVFLEHVDRSLPQYAQLRQNIEGLMAAYDVESTIQVVSDEGDDQRRSVTLDWVLLTEEKAAARGTRTTRRSLVQCRIERRGKRWKITALTPIEFFQK